MIPEVKYPLSPTSAPLPDSPVLSPSQEPLDPLLSHALASEPEITESFNTRSVPDSEGHAEQPPLVGDSVQQNFEREALAADSPIPTGTVQHDADSTKQDVVVGGDNHAPSRGEEENAGAESSSSPRADGQPSVTPPNIIDYGDHESAETSENVPTSVEQKHDKTIYHTSQDPAAQLKDISLTELVDASITPADLPTTDKLTALDHPVVTTASIRPASDQPDVEALQGRLKLVEQRFQGRYIIFAGEFYSLTLMSQMCPRHSRDYKLRNLLQIGFCTNTPH